MESKPLATRVLEKLKLMKLTDRINALKRVVDNPDSYDSLVSAHEDLIELHKEHPKNSKIITLLQRAKRGVKNGKV